MKAPESSPRHSLSGRSRAGLNGGPVTACDRRSLLAGSGLGVLLSALPASLAHAGEGTGAQPRLSFFDERPMIDPSGQLPPYRPLQGHRGAGPLSWEDEAALRFVMPFLT